MDAEFTQLRHEISRIADTTKYNDKNLLFSIAPTKLAIHVGWDKGAENKIEIQLDNFTASGPGGLPLNNWTDAVGNFVNTNFSTVNVLTVSDASHAVVHIDGVLSTLNYYRSSWGAVQNRLESTVANLANVNENMASAKSRIMDADFAKESAELAKSQVLQQAGMSMLAQANNKNSDVLSLITG